MIPPKYNFYIGSASSIYISSGTTINNSGEFIPESGKYASGLNSIPDNMPFIFINLTSLSNYNVIFFYDKSRALITFRMLPALNNTVIVPPSNAKYWGIRFTNEDTNFMSKKDTKFIYNLNTVNPHYKDLSKKYAKESGQEFFRISLDGKINLFGQDYELVANSNLEDQLIFIVDKYNRTSEKWIEYYKGEFNKTDCKFDYDKKKCELKTTAIDDYNEVMNKYENTYDLIKLAPEITKIKLHKRSLMQVYVRGANSISNFFGGIYWEDDVNEAIDDHNALINTYYFAYIKAGNEFYIRQAGISDVNGVYAGINGYWSCWNGFTCKMELVDDSPTMYWIRLYRNSDNTLLYQSERQWAVSDSNNKYIGREDIKMVNVSNSSDTFLIESPFVYHIYQRLLCDVDTVTDSEGTKNTYALPSNDFVTDNRNYKRCIGLQGGLFFCTSRAVDEPTRYGLNDYGQYFTNQFISSVSGLGRPLPISRNSWANASLWYVYEDFTYKFFEERLRKQYTLRDSYSIAAAIKAILNKIDPTLKHEATAEYSRFLYDETVPLSMNRFYVYITQKTNILKGEYDQPAQKAEISFEDLMKMLRDCFRCYWYIEDGKFKIEHISFFMRGGSYSYNSNVQLDFTKLTDQFNKKPSAYFQSEVEYDKSDLNQRYEFGWMDDVTDLFGGVTIDVNSNYIQKDKNEEININQFSSDVDYMLFNPSNFSDDGFALLCPIMQKDTQDLVNLYDQANNVGFIKTNGTSVSVDNNWRYTDYISVSPGQTIDCILQGHTAISSVTFYNASREVLQTNVASTNGEKIERTFTAPANSAFVRICGGNPGWSGQTYKQYANTAINRPILPIIETQLIDENGDRYKAIAQNWYASWAYLARFYMYDMPAENIECNVLSDSQLYTYDIKMCMKHTIEFPVEEDLDELELIKTSIGNGKIDEYSINVNTRTAKVKLMYRPQ